METNSAEAEKAYFKGLMEEDLTNKPWRQAMVAKEKDGVSCICYQKAVEGKPLNVVRAKTIMRDVDIELIW